MLPDPQVDLAVAARALEVVDAFLSSYVQNLEREGDTFTASADWQGEQADPRVNAVTGETTRPEQA